MAACNDTWLGNQNAWRFDSCMNVHFPPQFPQGVEHKSGSSTIGCLSLDVLQTDIVLVRTVFYSAQSLEKKCHTKLSKGRLMILGEREREYVQIPGTHIF